MGRKVFPYKQLTKAVLSTALITSSVGIVNINSGNIVYAESSFTIMAVPTLENGYSGEATKLKIQGYEETHINEGDLFNVTVPSGVTWNETYTTEGTVTSATYERLDDRTIQFKVTGTPSELIIPINVNINGASEGDLHLTIDAPPNSFIPVGQVTFARVVGEVSEPVTITEFNDKVLINGSEVLADGGFYKVNNVVISPIRTISEALGVQTEWKADSREIVFTSQETELILSVDSNEYRLNGNVGHLEVKPIVHNGRTLVPLQFVVETFGGTVEIKSDSQTPLRIMTIPTLENGYSGQATSLIIQGYKETPFKEGVLFNVIVPSGVTWNETYTTEGTVTSATYERLDDRTIQFKVIGTPSELIIPVNIKIEGVSTGEIRLIVEAPPSSLIPNGEVTFAHVVHVVGEASEILTPFNDKIIINGKEIVYENFYETKGEVLASIRTTAEALGVQTEWNSNTKEITFKTQDTELILSMDNSEYRLNGNAGKLEVKPTIYNGRSLVPLQFVVETFGGTVEIKSDSQTPSEINLELINKTSKSITIAFGIDNLTGKYEIYRDNELIDTIQTNEKATFTDKGLEPNTLYNYKVKLIKEDGQYEWTPSIEATTEIDECFIATASYGSKFEPSVVVLRNFRDSFLMTNSLGKSFVHVYYKYSPPIAKNIADSEMKKSMVRFLLRPLVSIAQYILKK